MRLKTFLEIVNVVLKLKEGLIFNSILDSVVFYYLIKENELYDIAMSTL